MGAEAPGPDGGDGSYDAPVADGTTPDTGTRRLLLTVLGTTARPTTYRWADPPGGGADPPADRTSDQPLAPLAILELSPPGGRPEVVVAAVIPEAAAETLPILEDGCREAGAQVVPVEISADPGRLGDAVNRITREVTALAGDGAEVVVDLTHGFRHISTLVYLAALYLDALEERITVTGVTYGMLPDGTLHRLPGLVELPRWVGAVRTFNGTGSARDLADLVEEDPGRTLRRLSEAYLAGMPVDLAEHLRRGLGPLGTELRRSAVRRGVPMADALRDRVVGNWERWRWPDGTGGSGDVLTADELARQRRLVDDLWDRGHHVPALLLASEWLTSWVMLRCGAVEGWLGPQRRRPWSRRLTALRHAVGVLPLSPDQEDLARIAGALAELRNAVAHAGMRRDRVSLVTPRGAVARHLRIFRDGWARLGPDGDLDRWLAGEGERALRVGTATGRVLLSPQGQSPGVLYSAVRAVTDGGPDAVVVVCSCDSERTIGEALERAGYRGSEPVICVLSDPYAGVDELDRVVEEARPHVVGADRCDANLTGGTTLMGLAVGRIAEEAARFEVGVHRFGLIDRRPPAEQRSDPWVAGERVDIDAPPPDPGG